MRKEVVYIVNSIKTNIENLLVQLKGIEKKQVLDDLDNWIEKARLES
jgi:hypothetical protein